jgi:hypothetical protein
VKAEAGFAKITVQFPERQIHAWTVILGATFSAVPLPAATVNSFTITRNTGLAIVNTAADQNSVTFSVYGGDGTLLREMSGAFMANGQLVIYADRLLGELDVTPFVCVVTSQYPLVVGVARETEGRFESVPVRMSR